MELLHHLKSALGFTRRSGFGRAARDAHLEERRKHRRINARKGTRVLIIDDSIAQRTALAVMFATAGYIALQAKNAEHGLLKACFEKPDLIILDIDMPGINGIEALQRIRHDPVARRYPVILVGDDKQSLWKLRAKGIDAEAFLKKPFSRHDLFQRIEKLLDQDRVPRRV